MRFFGGSNAAAAADAAATADAALTTLKSLLRLCVFLWFGAAYWVLKASGVEKTALPR